MAAKLAASVLAVAVTSLGPLPQATASSASSASTASAASAGSTAGASARTRVARPVASVHACTTPAPGEVACDAIRRTDIAQNIAPSGFGPAALQGAYRLPSATAGRGQVVAVVDAYDDPAAEADLAVYRAYYGLPACTTANGCFRKVNQSGGTRMPPADAAWAQEISLDLDMVSAACPLCRILLVEADDAQNLSVAKAVNTAAKLKATAISNSYGSRETAADTDAKYGKYYDHPGIAVTASAGDGGEGVEYPAASRYVTAVGGTSLSWDGAVRTETVWSHGGSGCSTFEKALKVQASFDTGCAGRAVADVAAVADPATGVAAYDSVPWQGSSGWQVFGGTSAAAPIIASVFALAGNAATVDNAYPYRHASAFNDVTSGADNPEGCAPVQLCTARTGWDGPTGLGTPNGIGGF